MESQGTSNASPDWLNVVDLARPFVDLSLNLNGMIDASLTLVNASHFRRRTLDRTAIFVTCVSTPHSLFYTLTDTRETSARHALERATRLASYACVLVVSWLHAMGFRLDRFSFPKSYVKTHIGAPINLISTAISYILWNRGKARTSNVVLTSVSPGYCDEAVSNVPRATKGTIVLLSETLNDVASFEVTLEAEFFGVLPFAFRREPSVIIRFNIESDSDTRSTAIRALATYSVTSLVEFRTDDGFSAAATLSFFANENFVVLNAAVDHPSVRVVRSGLIRGKDDRCEVNLAGYDAWGPLAIASAMWSNVFRRVGPHIGIEGIVYATSAFDMPCSYRLPIGGTRELSQPTLLWRDMGSSRRRSVLEFATVYMSILTRHVLTSSSLVLVPAISHRFPGVAAIVDAMSRSHHSSALLSQTSAAKIGVWLSERYESLEILFAPEEGATVHCDPNEFVEEMIKLAFAFRRFCKEIEFSRNAIASACGYLLHFLAKGVYLDWPETKRRGKEVHRPVRPLSPYYVIFPLTVYGMAAGALDISENQC